MANSAMLAIVPTCSCVGRWIPSGLSQPIRGGRFLLASSSGLCVRLTRCSLSSSITSTYTGAHPSRDGRHGEPHAGEVCRPGMGRAGPPVDVRTPRDPHRATTSLRRGWGVHSTVPRIHPLDEHPWPRSLEEEALDASESRDEHPRGDADSRRSAFFPTDVNHVLLRCVMRAFRPFHRIAGPRWGPSANHQPCGWSMIVPPSSERRGAHVRSPGRR